MITRRDALKRMGALAGLAAGGKFLSACGSDDDGPVGITNYVYLMLENRTYDHVLGARKLEGLGGDGLTTAMVESRLERDDDRAVRAEPQRDVRRRSATRLGGLARAVQQRRDGRLRQASTSSPSPTRRPVR